MTFCQAPITGQATPAVRAIFNFAPVINCDSATEVGAPFPMRFPVYWREDLQTARPLAPSLPAKRVSSP